MNRHLKSLLALAALTSLGASGAAAQRAASNAFFLELGGNAGLYSVNYERVLPSNVALRAGLSYMSLSATSGSAEANVSSLGIPVTFSYLGLGSGSAKFELGAGALFQRFSGSSSWGFGNEVEAGAFVPLATFIGGLRLAPAGGGFNFKLAFTPLWHPDVGFFPWGGMGLGVGF